MDTRLGEAWGWAVGGGAKFVNFLLPRDMIEFQVNYCHGAYAYCNIPGLYTQNWMYGRANTIAMGYAFDGIFNNGGQVQLTDSFSYAVGYQHYWNQQWRTSLVGGQAYNMFNGNATSQLCGDVSAVEELSPREFEILRMILDARSTDEIASAFNLSPKTVANYHYAIKSKLGARSDIELVYFCMRQGLVTSLAVPGAA